MSERHIVINNDIETQAKFIEAMKAIKKEGYIKSHRANDTGIGKTLEDKLGIIENSVQAADINDIELKATRKDSTSMLTLFTKSPDKPRVNNKILRAKYGYKNTESLLINNKLNILHTTINGKNYNTLNGDTCFKLIFKDDKIYIKHNKDGILDDIYWSTNKLNKAFLKKFPSGKIYYVKANVKKENGIEYFEYDDVYLLENFDSKKLMENLKSGFIEIDIRLGIYQTGNKKGKAHDNGTAFRLRTNKLDSCFDKITKII